jgi:signal transduction histidine kinase
MPSEIPRRPSFFWQGVLILLPVAVLAVVGLVSLRQEERVADIDARRRAAQSAESLARAVRSFVNDELRRFFALQNDWMNGLHPAEIEIWERDYPGLKLADFAASPGEITADGRQISPPEYPVVPVPPPWFQELSPAQRFQWDAMRSATNLAEMKKRQQTFFAGNPPEDARLAARCLTNSPVQILNDTRPLDSESGISFQTVACYRLLSAKNARLSEPLLDALWRQTIENPSFVAPKLLDLAEGLTADAAFRQKVLRMRMNWDARLRAQEYLAAIRRSPDLHPWKEQEWSRWVGNGEMLAMLEPERFPNTSQGYKVRFVPAAVAKGTFAKALEDAKFLIPEYAAAAVTVDGMPLIPGGDEKDLLGNASTTVTIGNLPFDVRIFLTSRERMLSTERRRVKLFAGLILGAVFAALAGFVAAQRAFRRQLQLYEMKSNFVSSVSHELRAPIASVRLMAENLAGGKIPESRRQSEYFRFIVQECRRLSALIENVLDFSRIEQGRKDYEFEPTNLVALTQTTVKLMEPYAEEKGIKLQLAPVSENIEWNVDGRAIQQTLVNFIDNAVKHSPQGECVIVEIGASPMALRLSVSDHGPGIPEAEHEKIFERFYRRGSELRRETQGVGIGLSVVKHIVEAHGGRIVVKSQLGKGSKFTIELPARSQHE